jgi:hypothetical protein
MTTYDVLLPAVVLQRKAVVNDNGREANYAPGRVIVRWSVRDRSDPECNQPLGWNDTGCLRTCHTDFAYHWPPRGVPMRRALSASEIWSGLGTSTPVRRGPSNQD